MKAVFADAGYFIGLIDRKDPHRLPAMTAAKETSACHVVTSEMVLWEILAFFSNKGSVLRQNAAVYVAGIQQDPYLTVVSHNKKLFDAAFKLYAMAQDKEWSLTDCASFEIMRQKQIREALAHDHHFEQAGFVALLRH